MAKFEYMQRAFSSELKPRARLVLQVHSRQVWLWGVHRKASAG